MLYRSCEAPEGVYPCANFSIQNRIRFLCTTIQSLSKHVELRPIYRTKSETSVWYTGHRLTEPAWKLGQSPKPKNRLSIVPHASRVFQFISNIPWKFVLDGPQVRIRCTRHGSNFKTSRQPEQQLPNAFRSVFEHGASMCWQSGEFAQTTISYIFTLNAASYA